MQMNVYRSDEGSGISSSISTYVYVCRWYCQSLYGDSEVLFERIAKSELLLY